MTSYRSVYTTPLPINAAIKTFTSALISWAEEEYSEYLGPRRLDGFEPGMRYQPDERLELIWADERQQSGDRLVGFAVVDALGEAETITRVMIAGGPADPRSSVVSIEIGPDLPTTDSGTAVVPGFVADLLGLAKCDDHGIILTADPLILTPEDIPEFLKQISEDDHHVQVVLAGTSNDLPLPQWRDFIGRMLAPVRGMSAIYVLNAAATECFNQSVEAGHRAEPGALRVLAPGARLNDAGDTVLHRLIPASDLLDDERRDRLAFDLCEQAIDFALGLPLARREQRYLEVLDRFLDELLTTSPVVGHGLTTGRAHASNTEGGPVTELAAGEFPAVHTIESSDAVDTETQLEPGEPGIAGAQTGLERPTSAAEELSERSRLFEAEIVQLRSQVDDLESHTATLEASKAVLEQEAGALRQSLLEAERLRADTQDVRTPAARARELAEFHSRLAQFQTENETLREENERLARSNIRLREEIARLTSLRSAEVVAAPQATDQPTSDSGRSPATTPAPQSTGAGTPRGKAAQAADTRRVAPSTPEQLGRLGALVNKPQAAPARPIIKRRTGSAPRRYQPVPIPYGMETVARARLVTTNWDLAKSSDYDSVKVKQKIAEAQKHQASKQTSKASQTTSASTRSTRSPKVEAEARRIAALRRLEQDRERVTREAIRAGRSKVRSRFDPDVSRTRQNNPRVPSARTRAAEQTRIREKTTKQAIRDAQRAKLKLENAARHAEAAREALTIVAKTPVPTGDLLVLEEHAQPYVSAVFTGEKAPEKVLGALRDEPGSLAVVISIAEKVVAVEAPISTAELMRSVLLALGSSPDKHAENLWRRLLTVVPVQIDKYGFVWGLGRVVRPDLVLIKSARTTAARGQIRMTDVHPFELALLVSSVLAADRALTGRRLENAVRRAISDANYGSYPTDEDCLRYARSLVNPTNTPLQLSKEGTDKL